MERGRYALIIHELSMPGVRRQGRSREKKKKKSGWGGVNEAIRTHGHNVKRVNMCVVGKAGE